MTTFKVCDCLLPILADIVVASRKFNKLTSGLYASVLLLMINFVITLSTCCRSTSRRRVGLQQTLTMLIVTKFIINKRTDVLKTDVRICFFTIKRPKLIFKRRKEMHESMEDAIAAESEFHRLNWESHRLVN